MKTVIEMAREAGFLIAGVQEFVFAPSSFHFTEELERLVALARADEREACANEMAKIVMIPTLTHGALVKLSDVVNAIRARGNA